MDTTTNSTPSNANGFSEANQEGQVSPTLSKEVGGGLAKECGGSKKPQIKLVGVSEFKGMGCPYSNFTFEINRRDYTWTIPDYAVLELLDKFCSTFLTPKRDSILQNLQIPYSFDYQFHCPKPDSD